MSHWYTIFCKPRGEATAEGNLQHQGYSVYLPRMQIRRRRAGKWVDSVEPLFPRYLFLKPRDVAQSIAPVRSTPGVSDLVRFGGQPALVSETLIEALLARQDPDSGTHVQRTAFKPGARVKFIDGPFVGLEGIFSLELGMERALVLLDLLGKMNKLKVSRDWLALPV